jgi:hypothetical protein
MQCVSLLPVLLPNYLVGFFLPTPSPTLPELLVEPPEHYNSDGVAGQLAIGNDGGSPPNPAFFICLVTGSAEASPPTTALWLIVNAVGVFSTTF